MTREVIEVPVAELPKGERVALMSVQEYVRLRDMEARYWSQVGELRTANSTVNFLRDRVLTLHAQLRSAGVPDHVTDRVGASGPFWLTAVELADPETVEKLALQEEIARLRDEAQHDQKTLVLQSEMLVEKDAEIARLREQLVMAGSSETYLNGEIKRLREAIVEDCLGHEAIDPRLAASPDRPALVAARPETAGGHRNDQCGETSRRPNLERRPE